MTPHLIATPDELELVNRYHQGESIASLARERGITRQAMAQWLARRTARRIRDQAHEIREAS